MESANADAMKNPEGDGMGRGSQHSLDSSHSTRLRLAQGRLSLRSSE